jgi:hypothetical protein
VKRTATLTRKTPLARTSRLPRRRATPRRSSRVENPHYLAWLREQPCGVPYLLKDAAGPCGGPVDPEHKREGVGMGQRASDADAWACCRVHHDQRHDGRGVFATMSRAELRVFIRAQIAMFPAAYTAHLASLPRTTFGEGGDQPPGTSSPRLPAPAAGHLPRALEQLLPEPGAIAVGSPVQLGGREGAVEAVLPGCVRVRWIDGETTTEALSADHRRA